MQTTILELQKIVSQLKQNNKKIGLLTGCFDLLHPGHIHLLKQSRTQVDVLIVGLESDAYIHSRKGENRPVNPINTRIVMLDAIKYVDYVFPIPVATNYKQMLQTIAPTHFFTVSARDRNWQIKQQTMLELGITFIDIEPAQGQWHSTSEIIARLRTNSTN